jgi:transcriptional regulator with XRE-family HTH domain
MKDDGRFVEVVRTSREVLGLTQRSLARKLGVEASHIANFEIGHRTPSLKLVGPLADILGLDRQALFILAHPEAKKLIAAGKPAKRLRPSPSWRRFIKNHQLLARYHVTDRELRILEHVNSLGTLLSANEYLAILTLIRDS